MSEENDNRSISKLNSGFPSYLDFGKLRSEGISYLGELSGKIWTDHNVHDPGITILEVLCYALIDLGYRTNIPITDLLAAPDDTTNEPGSYYSPAQILANNPLTITDFRKLLIDIDEVNNAWLEVATDITADGLCSGEEQPGGPILLRSSVTHAVNRKDCCETYLNGIYKVYIDLEINLDKVFANDAAGRKKYEDDIKAKILGVLAAHRNLCEDFLEPVLLAKTEIGICANIELEDDADADSVYLAVTEKLQDFLSPVPKFYTLPQLLNDRKKSIEEIFAGRPLINTSSHGFLDTEELESLPRRRVIHVSDIYNELLQVSGVKTIRSVSIRSCSGNAAPATKDQKWKFLIPKDHIPVFSTSCSGFNFYKKGIAISFDAGKHEYFIQMRRDGNAKVPYKVPSPYLDLALEKGNFRKGINEYYSIQHDFPKVYGIAKGALANDVSDARKAQALQLKGYLLFYDQLLANYVAQLSEVRKLFAFKNGEKEQHSYFAAIPESVPDLGQLLRFNASASSQVGPPSRQILAYPVSFSKINDLLKNDQLKKADIEKDFPAIDYASANENRLAMALLQSDFMNDTVKPIVISKGEKCFFYYLLCNSAELALMGRRYYETEREAMDKALEVLYTGKFEESYVAFSVSQGARYSFDIEADPNSYGRYLEMITENKALFTQRRHQFLDHLLSRFAESFTEFAILQFKNKSIDDARLNGLAENFLSAYPELSSNRGKAYDYRLNGWNNGNLSGLEKKFKALSGINDMLRKSLCHFEVFKHDKQFLYKLELANQKLFYSDEKFDHPAEAATAASKLFSALADHHNYTATAVPEQPELYRLNIQLPGLQTVHSFTKYPDEASAKGAIDLYARAFSGKTESSQVYTSKFKYQATLRNSKGDILQTLIEEPDSREKAEKSAVRNINVTRNWTLKGEPIHGRLASFDKDVFPIDFVDTDAFKADINNTIIDKPELFTYDFLDKGNRFKFSSLKEFVTDKAAKEDYQQLILVMANEKNIRINEEDKDRYSLNVWLNDEKIAKYAREFSSRRKAEETREGVVAVMREHSYYIHVEELPDRYNFNFVLGTSPGKEMKFDYVAEDFSQPEAALKKAAAFRKMMGGIELRELNDEFFLVQGKAKNIPMARLVTETGEMPSKDVVEKGRKELALLKSIQELSHADRPQDFQFAARQDDLSDCGEYGYRLVDNDRLLAFSLQEDKLENPAAAEKYIKDLVKRYAIGYQWMRISMGGDIIRERKEKGATWFHYQVKTLEKVINYRNTASEVVVLFESVKGYASREDALKAFSENIYEILQHAEQLKNYGTGEYISDKEIFINVVGGDCSPTASVVYIPAKTISFLGSYPDEAFRRMVAMAESCPVKLIYPEASKEDSVIYNGMFPCSLVEDDGEECRKGKGKPQYYFVLKQDNQAIWQSVKSYDTASEAQLDFDFFYILLAYNGNYKLTCEPCSQRYRVFIREVLAESTRRYVDENSAWGVTGIEQFICTTQTGDAFHHFMDKENCLHHFYVACSKTPLVHPCTYETPQLRDRAMNRLRQAAEKKGFLLPEIINENGEKILVDTEGNRIAKIAWENANRIVSKDCEDERVEIFYLMLTGELEEYERKLRIEVNKGEWLSFSPLFDDIEKSDAFRKRLVCTALYYPVVPRENVTNGRLRRKFCLEIRFPGIRDCYEGGYRENPCDCEEDFPGDDCDIAWTSDCCFDTCEEAMNHFRQHMELLLDYRNYRAIDDCPCGPYRIALHELPGLKDCHAQVIKPEWIIAYNPQRYPTSEMACDAIDRAKRLINDEGLHLAEHILLRPQTADECQCMERQRRGGGGDAGIDTGCDFRWTNPGDPDLCIDPMEVCFTPGEDPFSFIATIVLPAWPERYRSADNREIIEMLLRREAPAHVLLRILWLTPHDLCRFESMVRKWQLSLAHKTMCGETFDYCAFLEFFFHYRWEHLADCRSCLPCEEPVTELPCEEVKAVERYSPKKFLSDTDQLFAWRDPQILLMKKMIEAKTNGTPGKEVKPSLKSEKPTQKPGEVSPKPLKEAKPSPKAAPVEPVIEPEKDIDAVIKKPKRAFVNQRRTARKVVMTGLQSELKKMDVAAEIASFLDDINPDAARLEKIMAKILVKIKALKGKKPALNKRHALALFELAVHHYLDKQVFNGKDLKKINAINGSLVKAGAAGLDLVKIYKDWQSAEVLKYETDLPGDAIRKLFLDRS